MHEAPRDVGGLRAGYRTGSVGLLHGLVLLAVLGVKTHVVEHAAPFVGLFLDMKGDIFTLQGKPADAKAAYEAALAKLDSKGSQKQYTQLKLDAVAASAGAAK